MQVGQRRVVNSTKKGEGMEGMNACFDDSFWIKHINRHQHTYLYIIFYFHYCDHTHSTYLCTYIYANIRFPSCAHLHCLV